MIRENIVFDYTELQMILKSQTSSDNQNFDSIKLQKIITSTFENSRKCQEIFDVLRERLNSKRSTIKNIIKALDIFEILLLRGSEKFISIVTKDKYIIKNLTIHNATEVKEKANIILQLETDRSYLFARRNMPSTATKDDNEIELVGTSTDNLNY